MKKSIFLLSIMLIGICSFDLFTFSFTPIIKDFTPDGNGRIQTFRITNDGDEPIAVQISMFTRSMGRDGQEINNDASHLFTVYPHQLILQPEDSQSIRVQWNGPETIVQEQSFRIVAEQLPINFNRENTNKGQLNIVYRYVGSVYIVPENAESRFEVQSIRPEGDKLIISILNRGIAHSILEDPVLRLNDGSKEITLRYSDLPGMAGENILAGVQRDFPIQRPSQLTGDEISGEISYKETR